MQRRCSNFNGWTDQERKRVLQQREDSLKTLNLMGQLEQSPVAKSYEGGGGEVYTADAQRAPSLPLQLTGGSRYNKTSSSCPGQQVAAGLPERPRPGTSSPEQPLAVTSTCPSQTIFICAAS